MSYCVIIHTQLRNGMYNLFTLYTASKIWLEIQGDIFSKGVEPFVYSSPKMNFGKIMLG